MALWLQTSFASPPHPVHQVVFVPVYFYVRAYVYMTASVEISLCIEARSLSAALVPEVGLIAEAGGEVNFGWGSYSIARAGVAIRATFMQTQLVPRITIYVLPSGNLRACLDVSIVVRP
jgi:hypothetical protein